MDHSYPVVWITPQLELPEVCICCGMFGDQKKVIKRTGEMNEMVESTEGHPLGCLLFFLGPLGILLSLLLPKKKQMVRKTKKTRCNLTLPTCVLCEAPTPIEESVETGHFAFQTHPKFAAAFERLNP